MEVTNIEVTNIEVANIEMTTGVFVGRSLCKKRRINHMLLTGFRGR